MGLAFKPNIDDLRESPQKLIVQKLLKDDANCQYLIVEPNIKKHNIFKLVTINEAIDKSDIIVFLVAHNQFKNLKIPKDKIILDFCNVNMFKTSS